MFSNNIYTLRSALALIFTFTVLIAPGYALQSIGKELTKIAALQAGILAGMQAFDLLTDSQTTYDGPKATTLSKSDLSISQVFLIKIIHSLPEGKITLNKPQDSTVKHPHNNITYPTDIYSTITHKYPSAYNIFAYIHRWLTNQSHFISFTRDRPLNL